MKKFLKFVWKYILIGFSFAIGMAIVLGTSVLIGYYIDEKSYEEERSSHNVAYPENVEVIEYNKVENTSNLTITGAVINRGDTLWTSCEIKILVLADSAIIGSMRAHVTNLAPKETRTFTARSRVIDGLNLPDNINYKAIVESVRTVKENL